MDAILETTAIKPVITPPPKPLIKEIAPRTENLLEGSILAHGFKGNLTNEIIPREHETIGKILATYELLSPSLRHLDVAEKDRYGWAPFDKNRIVFENWKGEDTDQKTYIEDAFFAAPTTILEGSVPTQDPGDSKAIAAYNKEGVRISMEQGILFLSPELIIQFRDKFEALAKKAGLTFAEFMNKHTVILPKETFQDQKKLWHAVSERIEPAIGVSASVISRDNQNSSRADGDFTYSLNNHSPAHREELGLTGIKKGSAISLELIDDMKRSWQSQIDWLEEVEQNIDSNPQNIEDLREKDLSFQNIQNLINEIQPNNSSATFAYQYDEKRRQVLEKFEVKLEQKYPNAPLQLKGFARPLYYESPYRGGDGKLHFDKNL